MKSLATLITLLALSLHASAEPAKKADAPKKAELSKKKEPPVTGPKKWAKNIDAFEAADKTTPPPAHGIEFVGSSTMVKWVTLKDDFAGLPVFNRGFGGCQSSDVLFYLDRVVLAYQPKTIVFYAGDNDLGAGKKAAEVIGTWKKIQDKIVQSLPETRVIYLGLRPSIKREALQGEQRKVNEGIKALIEGQKNFQFVDLFPALLNAEGKARADLLSTDNLHLNAEGYKVLTAIVKPLLTSS